MKYNTKQRGAVLEYIASLKGGHVTAAAIVRHFEACAVLVGRTTVYRHLDKLTESGVLRRFTADGVSCYQYAGGEECHTHFHLKCEGCGELIHLQCETLNDISRHISDKHAFQLDYAKTVLYGKCETCV